MARSEASGWRLDAAGGARVARCLALEGVPGIGHAVSTRRAPVDPDRLMRAAGLAGPRLALPRQVHGGLVVEASALLAGPVDADGVILAREAFTRAPVPAVRAADCVPILLAARDGSAVAAIHAGWRGTAARIAEEAVERLRAWGVRPEAIVAALGPAIGPCCYEVGEEVVAALAATGIPRAAVTRAPEAGARAHADLHAANRLQLERAGVDPSAIHAAPWCTRCRNDLFFSARAEGGRAGRQIAAIGPAVPPP